MEGMMTVSQLIAELQTFPEDALVMVPVIKYPGEIMHRPIEEAHRWHLGTDVEVVPLEQDDIIQKEGQCWLVIELAEFNEERAMLNGATTVNGS